MKNFKPLWAKKAQNKSITVTDMVDRCILKSLSAKAENKEELVVIFLKKAFTPTKSGNYRAAIDAARALNHGFNYYRAKLFASECLETEDDWNRYYDLLQYVTQNWSKIYA